jgi:hypothetical protein
MPGAEENRRIQAGIDAVMRDIIADPRKNPTAMPPSETVTVVGAPKVVTAGEQGWQAPEPLASPPGQAVIAAMCDAALPSPRVARMRAQLAKLSPEQQATVLSGIEAEPGGKALRRALEAP